MNVTFENKTVPCRRMMCGSGFMKPGDFLQWQGSLCKIVTVQREAFDFHLNQFVMVTVQTREGKIVPVPSPGKREVFRPTR